MKYVAWLAFLLSSTSASAQLQAEFSAVQCTPTKEIAAGISLEKTARDTSAIVITVNGERSTLTQAKGVISNVIRSPQGDFIAYFLVNPKAPKFNGWVLQRLSDGHSEHVAESQLAPESACFSPDGKKLAYVSQSIEVVQIDLAPAYARLTFHDHPQSKAGEG